MAYFGVGLGYNTIPEIQICTYRSLLISNLLGVTEIEFMCCVQSIRHHCPFAVGTATKCVCYFGSCSNAVFSTAYPQPFRILEVFGLKPICRSGAAHRCSLDLVFFYQLDRLLANPTPEVSTLVITTHILKPFYIQRFVF